MTRHDYEPDHRGTAAGLVGPEMDQLVKDLAEEGMRFAQSISPVASGTYQASFRVDTGTETLAGDDRSVAHIFNDAPYAADVEAFHHVLRRTIDHLGGSL